jgi:hypothetical protein
MARQSLAWSHGVVTVEALGGMIGPTSFVLPDGRQVAPFHIAPWFDEALPAGLPGILRRLRGEWPCVPFGTDAPRTLPAGWPQGGMSFDGADVPHGHSSNVDWQFLPSGPGAIEMLCTYPDSHPIKALRRTIRPDPGAAALDFTLTVEARRPCRLPIGLHPTLRLPTSGQAELHPPAFATGRVFPLPVEASSRLVPDANFDTLDSVPTAAGRLSLRPLPLDSKNEELVQLCGIRGDFVLRYAAEGFQARLTWNTGHFPSVLLWVSNRGRDYAPWNSRHLALGVEPVCSAFDLGPAVSAAANPISDAGVPTAMTFNPDSPFTTHYRIAAEPLGAV